MKNEIKLFNESKIRSVWVEEEEEWYFSVVDVAGVLSESSNPRRYWSDLKIKLLEEGYDEVYEKIVQLKALATDGKMRLTDMAGTATILRIIQSIPSPNAEPFKRWLAEVGKQRLDEIANPELAVERMKETYRRKGYSEKWISQRMKSIDVRNELTDEWDRVGVKSNEYT